MRGVILFITFGLSLVATSARANPDSAPIPFFLGCQLRYTTSVACDAVIRSFFSEYGDTFVREDKRELAKVKLFLTDQLDPPVGVKYTYRWESDHSFNISDVVYSWTYSDSTDATQLLHRILKDIHNGSVIYDHDLEADTDGDKTGGIDQSPFYAQVGISGNASKTDVVTSSSAAAYLNGNYSTNRVRVITYGAINAWQSSYPNDNGGMHRGSNLETYAHVRAVYSFTGKRDYQNPDPKVRRKPLWSVVLMTETWQNKGANLKTRDYVGTGIEWSLVPFRRTENQELVFRLASLYNRMDLERPNDRGRLSESYYQAFLQTSAYWMLDDNKGSLNVSLTSYLNSTGPQYNTYSASTSVSYLVSKRIRVQPSMSVNYMKKSIMFPGEPNYANPILTSYLQNPAGISLTGNLTFSYTIGNQGRYTSDRRWPY